jgi:hypothetical protein
VPISPPPVAEHADIALPGPITTFLLNTEQHILIPASSIVRASQPQHAPYGKGIDNGVKI